MMDDPIADSNSDASSGSIDGSLDDAMLDAPTGAGLDAPTEFSPPAGTTQAATSQAATLETGVPGSLPTPGNFIGDYELIREIARGGMGVVYLAKQTKLNRFVALKMVLESDSASKDELERFANEARAAGALDHPGIVPVYEVSSHGGCPFFSMAYVDGKSLAGILTDGPLTPERAARIAFQVAQAIGHAHDQQIIHRDLKPANILLDREGVPKVTDFGVCKSLSSQSQLTSHGELIGTPHYMPPEQAGTPDAVIGPESDVYSIGAVLYAMLTARPPFQAASPIDVVAQVMTKDPVQPSKFFSGIPEDLETITMKCLSKSHRERYATAHLLADDLQRFLNDEPILAKPPGFVRKLKHAVRRHVFLASVSGTFALMLVMLTVLMGVALAQSRVQVSKLTELLKSERVGAKRFVYSGIGASTSEHEYDVERLTDAAIRLSAEDEQLSIHLAVYAGRLAREHHVMPPSRLSEQLVKISSASSDSDDGNDAGFEKLVDAAAQEINRPLTEFELAIYGLFDPSHKLGMGPDADEVLDDSESTAKSESEVVQGTESNSNANATVKNNE